ncbi:MAG: hypothetical protein EXR00_05575 [Alphaproteobacteria bacterium]|nr:hypothetical protein [Alphaproteobacteria bacterium]
MFEMITSTQYATWVRESWGWPYALTLHAFGTAVVVGLIFIIGLRLLGLFRTIPHASLLRLIPVIWVGVIVQAYSGFTLWTSKPDKYFADGMFLWKFSLVVLGVIVTLYFQKILKQEAAGWDKSGKASKRGVQFVALTALCWTAVLVAGRLTAYIGTLYG